MNEILQAITDFAMGKSIWVYLFIFFGKLTEVSLSTLRIVLINRGIRSAGSLIAFVEIMIWLVVAGSVLAGFSEDFLKGIVYSLAYAAGNYLGSWLDDLLAFGFSSVQVIISDPNQAKRIAEGLRAKDFGVTTLDVHGREEDHYMLLMTLKRKRLGEVLDWLHDTCEGAVITVSDVKSQRGAYLKKHTKAGSLRIER